MFIPAILNESIRVESKLRAICVKKIELPFKPEPGDVIDTGPGEFYVRKVSYDADEREWSLAGEGVNISSDDELKESLDFHIEEGWKVACRFDKETITV